MSNLYLDKNQKYVCGNGTGLNDFFSMVASVLNTAQLLEMNLNNLYFYHGSIDPYEDLNKYLNFKQINYINRKDYETRKEEFIMLCPQPSGNTNMSWGTPFHLRNFISYKKEILEEASEYFCPIGMHFRCMSLEAYHKIPEKQKDIEQELDNYKKLFLKNYSENNSYFCASDSLDLMNFLSTFKNVKYIKKSENPALTYNRRNNTKEAILDLAALSDCDKVYFTRGRFTELSMALNTKLIQTPFAAHMDQRSYRQMFD
jgi:hypothetical protein